MFIENLIYRKHIQRSKNYIRHLTFGSRELCDGDQIMRELCGGDQIMRDLCGGDQIMDVN